ncbi:acyltransferase [Candidatus Aminicenantes bacterium AC-708-M15]|jgi:acetyltransferase-like isoleucine patch superfamily enzyme|nr:acyltransferase [SCandidatus Aminicenantes bacterium Aminicenantia_JdfR_composite]MCP2596807.1 acyltransferase [Candidatus Aminicenantes bacterium AC-335-G13]MCP2598268.1 acyltransferase [Candidatus Aminicenantes bacterium AC-335-L06]MCP2604007.1 acyltransferase [Candidatus Aminicenantes bacterium AC-708-M15]MCP2618500.1 acyltransferase [Candidatus Aminicenantes bacterium AC-335-A11]
MKEVKVVEKASTQKLLINEKKTAKQKYFELFIGNKGFLFFIKYELIILLFSWIPGALGFLLRKLFYPFLFKKVGKGVVFGRNITIRHPHKISIGDNSFIDDNVVLDAKGEKNEGIVIGRNVYIGRNAILSCKEGSIYINDYCNISSNCSLLSETEISLGKYCFLAGHCYLVAGGNHSFDDLSKPIMFQPSISKGGIKIEEDVWLGASVTVLDGVKIGKGSVVGAGAVVINPLPEYSISVGVPAKPIRKRGEQGVEV